VNTLLITVHVLSCIVLILVVLLQAGRGADMGAAFGGASSPMFGSGSSSNPLARMTTITAVLFMTTALFLAVSSARRASVFDATPEPLAVTPQAESSSPPAGIPAPDAPAASPQAAAPAAPGDAPVAIPNVEGGAGTEAPAAAAPAAPAPPAAPAAPAANDAAPAAGDASPAANEAAPATPPANAPAAP
jgi:preprotein translocase subunit SecG